MNKSIAVLSLISFAFPCGTIADAQESQGSRTIIGAARDGELGLTGVCNPNEAWRYKSIADVRADLENGMAYYVACSDGTGTDAKVMPFKLDKITTEADGLECNNLSNLPTCADLGVSN